MKIISIRNFLLFIAVFAVLDLIYPGGSDFINLFQDINSSFKARDFFIQNDIEGIIGKVALSGLIIFAWFIIEKRFFIKESQNNNSK